MTHVLKSAGNDADARSVTVKRRAKFWTPISLMGVNLPSRFTLLAEALAPVESRELELA
jgi:hypothetical protein